MKPAVYTATSFWNEFIVDVNQHTDYDFLASYPLWLVDLHGTAQIPKPWQKAAFIQNHFGENAADNAPWYKHLDHNFYTGSVSELLDTVYPGFEFSASSNPTVSALVRDAQKILKSQNYDVGPIDGRFGAKTALALQGFQSKQGLNVNGRLDTQTAKALFAVVVGS
jgi:hypothetical protein